MNYYEHHIRDYDAATSHLTWDEDLAYTRLIRWYYRKEQPIPADVKEACRQIRAVTKTQRDAVASVLKEFFELRDDGWHKDTCDEAIARFKDGEPEREIKKANEENRLKRHREERSRLFKVLTDAGEHAPWNIKIEDLRTLVGRITGNPATRPATEIKTTETQTATAPATPATATQSPITNHQSPLFNSVPNGTGAESPPEGLQAKEAIFKVALPWLIERGMADKPARSLLGAACKQLGDEGAWALASDCMQEAPLEPASWLATALNNRMKTVSRGKPDKFAVAGLDHSSSRAAAEASMRKHGIVVPDNDEIPL